MNTNRPDKPTDKPTDQHHFLSIDPAEETQKICSRIRHLLGSVLKKRGLVVALSGGIDSSVTLGLCRQAVGPDRVLALLMPERDSSADTLELSQSVADHFGVSVIFSDITNILETAGSYQHYVDAVQSVIPEYTSHWQSKIVSSSILENGFTFFSIVAKPPDGPEIRKRLDLNAYLGIVAATNFKQRVRKMLEYYHADRNNYAVAGTPNRLEYDQGFFVKLGDGAADIKPIAHLYKSQVYEMARHLAVPDAVVERPPTTDTYSLPQQQDEFYFTLPYDKMDLCLYGKNNGIAEETIAEATGLSINQVKRVYQDIDQKRAATRYLHLPPLLMDEIPEIRSSAH